MSVASEKPEIQREVHRQLALIRRGVVDLLPEEEFRERLAESIERNRPLRIKQGFDPTSPDIHLGHTVGIRKLKQFQELGHQIVLIVGDYTAMVGDPSGQSATRKPLSYDDIMRNAETYQQQFFKVLDKSKTEIRFNGEWFKTMEFSAVMHLATKFTVARLIERDDFTKRFRQGIPISVHELFYPLMQGYDSVAIDSDLEIGATEQKFNLLAGRTIQEAYGRRPQAILTMPILVGLDGEAKMSKSLGNYIGIDEPAKEIFGKAMSIPDSLIYSYFELATDATLEELETARQALARPDVNPMLIKKQLGERLVDMYQGPGAGREAREEFERVFSQNEIPDDIPELRTADLRAMEIDPAAISIVQLLSKSGLAKSNGEARKLIEGGGVYWGGERVQDFSAPLMLNGEIVLKVGKRRFVKLIP